MPKDYTDIAAYILWRQLGSPDRDAFHSVTGFKVNLNLLPHAKGYSVLPLTTPWHLTKIEVSTKEVLKRAKELTTEKEVTENE